MFGRVCGAFMPRTDRSNGLALGSGRIWDALRPLLEAERFRPPLLRAVASAIGIAEVPLRRACKGFARAGLIVEVAPDQFFLRDAVLGLAEIAHTLGRWHIQRHAAAASAVNCNAANRA